MIKGAIAWNEDDTGDTPGLTAGSFVERCRRLGRLMFSFVLAGPLQTGMYEVFDPYHLPPAMHSERSCARIWSLRPPYPERLFAPLALQPKVLGIPNLHRPAISECRTEGENRKLASAHHFVRGGSLQNSQSPMIAKGGAVIRSLQT